MTEPSIAAIATSKRTPYGGMDAIILIVCVTILVTFRVHAFDLPLETDEGNYAYIGGRLLAGDQLYVDVWDHQPFGVFTLFAGVIALFGDTPAVFRWMACGFSGVSLILIFALLRTMAGRGPAAMGALIFAIVSSDPGTAGEGCNREIYMNTFMLLAWYLALLFERRRRYGFVIAAGSSLALASALKTVVAVPWVLLAAWLMLIAANSSNGNRRWRASFGVLVAFAVGPLVLWTGATAYFAATGRFYEFVDAVFLFNLSYSESTAPFFHRFVDFFTPTRFPYTFRSALTLWWAGLASCVFLTIRAALRRNTRNEQLVVILLFAGYLAACLPGRSWPHYYYLLIPGLIMCVSIGSYSLSRSLENSRSPSPPWRRGMTVAILGVLTSLLLWSQARDYLLQTPLGITIGRYNTRDFWGRAQGENIRRVTDPNDKIFVFGSDASIYYYARRQCASRYTMITALQSGFKGVAARRETLIRELEADPPRLILVLFDEKHPWEPWQAFLRKHYGEPVGWDFHDRTGEPIMFILTRRDQPIEKLNWDWDRAVLSGRSSGSGF